MATYTEHYSAKKPSKSENYDVDVANANNDLWDEEIFGKQDKIHGKSLSTNDFTNAYKQKLDTLKNYDDTKIKTNIQENTNNISELQEEQITQNTELHKLKTKLKRYENSNISGQVEDKNISIKDSSDLPLKSFNVVGNTEQNTENAIPYKKAEGTYLHLTDIAHKDTKSFSVIGNTEQEIYKDINKFNEVDFARQNSEYYSYDNKTGLRVLKADGRAFDGIEYITLLKPNTIYYIKVENISNLSSMQLFEYSSTYSYIKANTLTENGTIATSNNCSCVKIKFLSNTCPINIGHVIISEEDISYQPIESPSLDYPSEVKACGDNVNFFNYRTSIAKKVLNNNNELEDNNNYCTSDYMEIKPNKQYCFTKHEKVSHIPVPTDFFVLLYDENKTYVARFAIENGGSIEIIPFAKYMRVSYHCTSEYDSTLDPKVKIEEGSKATPYSQYGEGNISIKKSNKNIFNYKDIVTKSPNASFDKDGYITIYYDNSKGTSRVECNYIVNIGLKENTKYSIITEIKNVEGTGILAPVTTWSTYGVSTKEIKYEFSTIKKGDILYNTFVTRNNLSNIEDGLRTMIQMIAGASGSVTFRLSVIEGEITNYTYIPHEGKRYTIPVQAPFYEGDKFTIKDGKRYEEHNLSESIITGNEGWLYVENSQCWYVQDFFTDKLDYSEILSTHYFCMNAFATSTMLDRHMGSGSEASEYSNRNRLYIKDIDNAPTNVEEFKNWIKNLKIKVYYKLSTPTLIECTEEQNDILDEIEEDGLYLETTYIYSTDEIEPKISMEYDGYDGTPSTKYPSEVRACGDNVNFFNKLSMTGTANINFIDLKLKPNTSYTFSSNIPKKYDNQNAYIFATTKSHGYTTAGNGIWEGQTRTILSDNEGYISLAYRKDNNINSLMDYDYKIEKGKKATPWSPHGQGCISIEKSNKNLAIIEQGDIFDNSGANASAAVNVVRTNFIPFNSSRKLTVSFNTSLETRYRNYYLYDKDKKFIETIYGYTNGQTISTNLANVAFIRFKINGPANGNMTTEDIDFQVEVGEQSTGIISHQGKTYTIPTQAPFYEGDKFIINNGKRYEEHKYEKHIFDGTEGLYSSGSAGTPQIYQYNLAINNIQLNSDNYKNTVISNYFKHIEEWNNSWLVDNVALQLKSEKVVRLQTSKYTTIQEFRTYITEQYNAGTPVYIIYKLATPVLIECTKEQNDILDEIEEDGTYKNVTYYYSNDEVEPTIQTEYYKDPETGHNNLQSQIDEIKTLLSTTTTSAMLLDNLENDLVGEV